MKNYAHYITIPDEIVTAVNVEDEKEGYWNRYIPTQDFNDLLKKTVRSFGRLDKESKSIWMQGIYGVGKSHTITVLKHLMYDDLDVVHSYTERHKGDIDHFVLEDLYTLRSTKRFMPVMITGLKSITQPSELTHTLQLEVRKTLQKHGIELDIKDDFQTVIKSLDDSLINWDTALASVELRAYIQDKDDLRRRLEEGNKQLLDLVLNYFASKNQHFSSYNLIDWIKEVNTELQRMNHADGIIIFWDEFTQFLESTAAVRVFTEFQHLAELSNKYPIYLFLVTHKTITQLDTRISEREMSKIMDRFTQANFSRAEITTYKLLRSSIKRSEDAEFRKYFNENQIGIEPVVRQIRNHSLMNSNINEDISYLFPFHPYTAFVSAEISRLFGSVNRTIFKFLIDTNFGFIKFLKENPIDYQQVWLLADKIFDYFEEDFSKISSVSSFISQFRNNSEAVLNNGPEYLVIFKIIILLIIMKESSGNALLTPNDMNLDNALRGSKYYHDIAKVTSFLLDKGLIRKDLSHNYTMSVNSLPQDEVTDEYDKLVDKYQNRLLNLLNESEIKQIALDKLKIEMIRRPVKLHVISSYDKTQRLNHVIDNHYEGSPQEMLVIIYIADSENELNENMTRIEEYATGYKGSYHAIILQLTKIVPEATKLKLMRLEAESIVASAHNFAKQGQELISLRDQQRSLCINNLLDHQAWLRVCYSDYPFNKTISISDFADVLQGEIFKKIYFYGFEKIAACQVDTIWKMRGAQSTCASDFLDLSHRTKLATLKKHSKSCQAIFFEESDSRINSTNYIVADDMGIIDLPRYHSHPLWMSRQRIRDEIRTNKSYNRMNLGESLYFLSQPPFGFYKSSIHYAVMGFLLREHFSEFLDNHDQPLSMAQTKTLIEDLFNYWSTGDKKAHAKLEIRFYTTEQQELFGKLIKLFGLKCHESRKQIRWEISSKFLTFEDGKSYPLWVLKYATDVQAASHIIDLLQGFIGNSELVLQDYSVLLDALHDYWIEAQRIVVKDMLPIGFRKWLENISRNVISVEKLETAVRKSFPDRAEVFAWTEQKLENWISDYIENQIRIKNNPPIPDPTDKVIYTPPTPSTEVEMKNIIEQIQSNKDRLIVRIITKVKEDNGFAAVIRNLLDSD